MSDGRDATDAPTHTEVRVFDHGVLRHGARPASVVLALVVTGPAVLFGDLAVLAAVGVLAALVVLTVHMWTDAPRTIRIASDGLEVRALGFRRFVPWDDVTTVTSKDHIVTCTLRRGRPLELYRASRGALLAARPAEPLGSLGHEIATAVAQHRLARESPMALEAELARGERTSAAWIAQIRSLAASDAAYRARDANRQELLAVVERARDASARAAAALALRWLGATPDERQRVVAARMRVADPALAAALGAALGDHDGAALQCALRVRAGSSSAPRLAPKSGGAGESPRGAPPTRPSSA